MFKIKAPFKETLAQKEAIDRLVRNLKTQQKHHVLLGVTGCGKSVDGETPVLIKRHKKIELISIGELIDSFFRKYPKNALKIGETEVLSLNCPELKKEGTLEAFSIDPLTKKSQWKPIIQLIRHSSPRYLYKVKTACGREITVTGDHNFWVLRNGKFILLPTGQLKNTDYIPLPLKIPKPKKNFLYINLLEILKYEDPYSRFYEIKTNKSPYLPLTVAHQIACKLGVDFHFEGSTKNRVSPYFCKYSLPARIPISNELLELFGYYLAEGNSFPKSGYFQIGKLDSFLQERIKKLLNKLGLHWTLNKKGETIYFGSKIHAILLYKLMGKKALTKRLPDFWPNLSQNQLAILLRAYFDGNGDAFPAEAKVSATTISKKLACDLGYALLRFGIWSKLYKSRKKYKSPYNYLPVVWEIVISGKENLLRFKNYIGFNLPKKKENLEKTIKIAKKSKINRIPNVGDLIKEPRSNLNIIQNDLAKFSGVSREMITALETKRTNLHRETFEKLMNSLNPREKQNSQVHILKNLLNCFWTKIGKIEKIKSKSKYVYDLAIKDNETFFAGFGGLFVHNTFIMAKVIESLQRPALIISPNKTLCAQLFQEFKEFFPENACHFFISYYDYYQPEAYIPETDTYIEKDAKINEEIDRLRHATVQDVLTRNDVIVCASVSCIYNIGSPEDYQKVALEIKPGKKIKRKDFLSHLIALGYQRNDYEFLPSTFRVRGNTIDIFLVTGKEILRVEFFGDEIERVLIAKDSLSSEYKIHPGSYSIYPAHFWVTPPERLKIALENIRLELQERIKELKKGKKFIEAQRLEQRTNYDLEMIEETGYCHGIENYSRHLEFRKPGEPPWTLLDYFREDPLVFVDESHLTIPQLRAMANQDRARKETLIEYGFRLPSCIDNRPLTFEEFNKKVKKIIYVSATPGEYERKKAGKKFIVEQLIRPTGLLEPSVEVRPTKDQVKNLIEEIKKRVQKSQRTLVLTLTKRLAEALADYLKEEGISCQWLHSEVKALERPQILKELREGKYDVLIGINLLREGLDLPEVALIGILDADKEGFLRSSTTLIQIMGRAARHPEGHCILYADKITKSIREAIREIERRRKIQMEYNKKHGIVPKPVIKPIRDWPFSKKEKEIEIEFWMVRDVKLLEQEMKEAAKNLDFERAAQIRDLLRKIRSDRF